MEVAQLLAVELPLGKDQRCKGDAELLRGQAQRALHTAALEPQVGQKAHLLAHFLADAAQHLLRRQQDERLAAEGVQLQRTVLRLDAGQERPGHGQQDGLVQQQLVAVGHGVGAGHVHDEIQLFGVQPKAQQGGGKLHRVDFAAGKLPVKRRQDGGQQQIAPVGADAQPQQLAPAGSDVAELVVQPPEGGFGLRSPGAEQAARVGGLQPVGPAGEQRGAQLLFQRLQAQRKGRLGQVEPLSRAGDAFFLCDGQNIVQLVPVHTAPPFHKKNLWILS